MSLCGQKSMYVIQRLIPTSDRSRFCKAREPLRVRLNSGNEMRCSTFENQEHNTIGFSLNIPRSKKNIVSFNYV